MAIVSITTNDDCDFNRTFLYETTGAAPIDLTGQLLYMMLRDNAADITAVARFGSDTGEIVILTPATAGKFQIFIPQATLLKIGAGNFDHSLIMSKTISGTLYKQSIWTGSFVINPGPSR
jgi:hypothetical protein